LLRLPPLSFFRSSCSSCLSCLSASSPSSHVFFLSCAFFYAHCAFQLSLRCMSCAKRRHCISRRSPT
jgi:hypothetical protein